jgi:adenine-specific DNA-methyltransferase
VVKTKENETFPARLRDTLMLGDCVEGMRAIPDGTIDFILTDPPYVARFRDRSGRTLINDDNDRWLKPAFAEAFRILRPNRFLVCFYGWPKVDRFLDAWHSAGFRPLGHFVAVKRYTSSKRYVRYQHEMAYLLGKGAPTLPDEPISDILPWQYTCNRWHPTEKPLATLAPLIRAFTMPGELVLDPFAGSGSTLLAARMLDRHYCGFELDPDYHAHARVRLCQRTSESRQVIAC